MKWEILTAVVRVILYGAGIVAVLIMALSSAYVLIEAWRHDRD